MAGHIEVPKVDLLQAGMLVLKVEEQQQLFQ